MKNGQQLLTVNNLSVQFKIEEKWFSAVRNISFSIGKSEIIGIIGESGCGKSVTAFSLLRLLPAKKARVTQESILFQQKRLDTLNHLEFRSVRGKQIAIIFQDPLSCLNPVLKIKDQLLEVWQDKQEALTKIILLLEQVGLMDSGRILNSYPHQLSGGMRQRVMIVMALMFEPKLLIADEPTTALDVSVQAQILYLLGKLQKEKKMSLLLITHDMGVISQMCDFVYVMYYGKIVEQGKVNQVFDNPRHPYTKGLIDSINYSKYKNKLPSIAGKVPDLSDNFSGCSFAPRCSNCKSICYQKEPQLFYSKNKHGFACYYPH